jgi:hypothetical protein
MAGRGLGGYGRSILIMICAGCQSPELAATNVANVSGGGPIPLPTSGNTGTLEIWSSPTGIDKLAGIRTAMAEVFGSPATLATIDVNECTPPKLGGSADCVCVSDEQQQDFEAGTSRRSCVTAAEPLSRPQTLKNLTTSGFPLQFMLDLAPIGVEMPGDLEAVNPKPGSTYTITLRHDPAGIKIVSGGEVALKKPGEDDYELKEPTPLQEPIVVAVGFPIVAEFPQNHVKDVGCDCSTNPIWPVSPPFAGGPICKHLCLELDKAIPDSVAPFTCPDVDLKIRVNRAEFAIGIMPSRTTCQVAAWRIRAGRRTFFQARRTSTSTRCSRCA